MTTFDELNQARKTLPKHTQKDDPLNVVKIQCKSCPFRYSYENRHDIADVIGFEYGEEYLAWQRAALEASALSGANRMCHQAEMQGKQSSCRGARDYQIEMFYRMGVINSPTYEAFKQTFYRVARK